MAIFPQPGRNPYVGLLRSALQSTGVELVDGHHGLLGWRWLKSHARTDIVLLLNWLSPHYGNPPSILRAFKFVMKLAYAKSAGYRLVWNCHNTMPHDANSRTWIHILVRTFVCRRSDAITVHSQVSRNLLEQRFHCGRKCVVIPHGNFIDVYGPQSSRETSRRALAIPETTFVYCLLGRLRKYKGAERLIHDFLRISDANTRLLIAGQASNDYERELQRLTSRYNNIDLRCQWIPDNQIPKFISAADVMVFPFSDILNSGSVILAMSYSAVCIVPELGSLPEILPYESALYFNPATTGGLLRSIEKARKLTEGERQDLRRRAYGAASTLSWETAASRITNALQGT